jgi:hypothetical protein
MWWPSVSIGGGQNDFVLLQYQLASGTAGPNYTNANDVQVLLNTEVTDTANIAVLAANVVTLQPGSYDFQANVEVGNSVDNIAFRAALFLRNVTAGTRVRIDQDGRLQGTITTPGRDNYALNGFGQFTILAATAFDLLVATNSTAPTVGLLGISSGEVEIYNQLMLRRYA